MYEVELKVRAAHAPLRDRLTEAGLVPEGRVRQVDTYYDAPHRDFAATDEALRVREERPLDADGPAGEPTVAVTYKGPLVDDRSKTREEHETAVADRDAIERILAGLGFEPAATVRKDRERYARGAFTVTLDAVAGLGEFVEVETDVAADGAAEPPDLGPAREGARDLLRELGLDPEEGIRTSYLGLLLADDTDGNGDGDESEDGNESGGDGPDASA